MRYSWRCHCRRKGKHWYDHGPDEVHFVHAKDSSEAKVKFKEKFPSYELNYIEVPFAQSPVLPF